MTDRTEFDIDVYEQRVLSGPCFICEIVACPDDPHEVIWEDERYIAFLSAYPTLPGYLLVSPKRHLVDVVRDLDVESYLDMQRVVHRVASAAATVMPTERVYLMSLGPCRATLTSTGTWDACHPAPHTVSSSFMR